jgi:pyridoxal/pyridoxine/pyridoxamine kinase
MSRLRNFLSQYWSNCDIVITGFVGPLTNVEGIKAIFARVDLVNERHSSVPDPVHTRKLALDIHDRKV